MEAPKRGDPGKLVYSDTKKIIFLAADLPLQNMNNILGINEEKLLEEASKPDEPEHCIFTKECVGGFLL